MIFVDSNIIIDLVEPNGQWQPWSEKAISEAGRPMVVNAVTIAETTRQFASLTDQMRFFDTLGAHIVTLSPEAAFRAGRAHAAYRSQGGRREAILADFLIGGHAATLGATLLTRDRSRFATYFPNLSLITPETHPDG